MLYNQIAQPDQFSLISLTNGETCGLSVIEITAVPSVEEKDEQLVNEKRLNRIEKYLQSLHDYNSLDYSLELACFSPAALSSGNRAVHVYLIFRIVNKRADKVSSCLRQFISDCFLLLEEEGFEFNVINPEKDIQLNQLISGTNDNDIFSILKSDEIIQPGSFLTSEYYSTNILPASGPGLYRLFSVLAHCSSSVISIELLPVHLDPCEQDSLYRAAYLLDRIAQGFQDEDYGLIKDYMAEKPSDIYKYYYNHQDSLFVINILVSAPNIYSVSLVNTVKQIMASGESRISDFSAETLKTNKEEINYCDNFYTIPWNIFISNQNRIYERPYWNTEQAPLSLFKLRFYYSAEEASELFRVPYAINESISGISLVNARQSDVLLDKTLTDTKNLQFGVLKGYNGEHEKIGISTNEISKHLFITGVPGCGKTTFAQNLLYQLNEKGIPFLIIEPAKNEYRALIDIIPEIQIFTPGNPTTAPFLMNPFIPPKYIKLHNYKSSLMSAFEIAFDMEGPLKSLFMETIDRIYLQYGWRDHYTSEDGGEKFGLSEFIKAFEELLEEKNYSSEVKNNIQTAGVVRLQNLINQDFSIFDTSNTFEIEEFLKSPTIIELNSIENEHEKSLITALLLTGIFSYTQSVHPDNYEKLNNVILLEEAHVILANHETGSSDSQEKSSSINLINRILAEKRASGLGLIIADQSPQKVTLDVIRNTGTKVAFRTVEKGDREVMSSSMRMDNDNSDTLSTFMDNDNSDTLSTLEVGSAFIYTEKLARPLLLKTDDFRQRYNVSKIIGDDKVRNHYDRNMKSFRSIKPFIECSICDFCSNGCDFLIRSEARYLADYIFSINHCSKNMTASDFIKLCQKIDDLLQKAVDSKFDKTAHKDIFFCSKATLLRKLQIKTNLPLSIKDRQALLNNPNFNHDINQ